MHASVQTAEIRQRESAYAYRDQDGNEPEDTLQPERRVGIPADERADAAHQTVEAVRDARRGRPHARRDQLVHHRVPVALAERSEETEQRDRRQDDCEPARPPEEQRPWHRERQAEGIPEEAI